MRSICSINGVIKNQSEAVLRLSDIESQYGFGVYESVKVRNSTVYFIEQHIKRLFHSAKLLSLQHNLKEQEVKKYIFEYVNSLENDACNLKLLLYGSAKSEDVQIIILSSAPLYPNRKWYREGVQLFPYQYERWMPQAKSLNMIASYYIYKKAQQNNCYDALLYDHNKNILEGTRTNIYLIKDKTIFSPPTEKILEGVTMLTLKKVLRNTEYKFTHKNLKLDTISQYDGMFLTSTSSKILPVQQVDSFVFKEITPEIFQLIKIYDEALVQSGGDFNKL